MLLPRLPEDADVMCEGGGLLLTDTAPKPQVMWGKAGRMVPCEVCCNSGFYETETCQLSPLGPSQLPNSRCSSHVLATWHPSLRFL